MAEQWQCPCRDCERARQQKLGTNYLVCPICSRLIDPVPTGAQEHVYAWCPTCGLVQDPLVATGRD
jgi:uncharacterized Zn finger protein